MVASQECPAQTDSFLNCTRSQALCNSSSSSYVSYCISLPLPDCSNSTIALATIALTLISLAMHCNANFTATQTSLHCKLLCTANCTALQTSLQRKLHCTANVIALHLFVVIQTKVVRCFESDDIIHVAGKVDPIDDIEVINLELALADLAQIEKRMERLKKGEWVVCFVHL